MDERYVSALEENPNIIDEKLKRLTINSLRSVFYMLGEYGFLRWIDTKDIPDRLKKLVVDEFNAEDLIKYSYCSGYYSGSYRDGNETIKVKNKNSSSASETMEHENLHFLEGEYALYHLGRFQLEGVTEYLKRLTSIPVEKRNTDRSHLYTYKENVDYVDFICQIVGDGLIRAYFDNSILFEFDDFFEPYLVDKKEDMDSIKVSTAYWKYREMLDKIHEYLHPVNEEERKESRKLGSEVQEELYPKLKEMIINIMVHSIRIKARNLDYYSNGVFQAGDLAKDLGKYISILHNTLVSENIFNLVWVDRYKSFNFISRTDFEKRALEAALSESGINPNKIPQIIELYIEYRFSIENEFSEKCPRIMKEDRSTTLKRILDKRLPKEKGWDVSEYFMTVANIIDKMGIKEDELQFVLDSIIMRYLPPSISPKIASEILSKHLHFYSELYRINQEITNNLHESRFVKISENQFIECRDYVLYFVQFNRTTGKLEYTLIPPDAETFSHNSNNEDNITKFRTPGERDTQHILTYNMSFSKVSIDGKEYTLLRNIKYLGNSYLLDALIHPIIENINQGKYVTKLNDAYDKDGDTLTDLEEGSVVLPDSSSLIVNFRLLAQDIVTCTDSLYIKNQFELIETVYSYLFEKEFFCIPSNFEKISDIFKMLEEPMPKSMQDELLKCMEEVNRKRREHIDSLFTINNVHFSSEEAQKKYREAIKTKQKKKERVLFNQMVRAFVQTEARDAISEPFNNDIYDVSEENIFINGVHYMREEPYYCFPIAKKVDYNTFFELLKKQLEEVPQNKKKAFIRRTINESVFMWYGDSFSYKNIVPYQIVERKTELVDGLIDIFNRYANGDEAVDISQTENIEKELIDLSKEIHDLIVQKRRTNVKEFESDSAEITYNTVKSIIEDPNLREEQKGLLVTTLVENSNRVYKRDQKMKAFMRLALAGDNIPTKEDIKKATDLLDLYKDKIPE